ncbi:MAG TPA: phosphonate C-P lyase system protein PhnH [Acetobacteraceae bacterium]|jgi:alpha-D-ribose 1-methylphosphonate 5-triphosphate synthase subunit PhnH|nr:phosphonate C-P lyase system protein PhnH [Acetobacteraceae bacterium]
MSATLTLAGFAEPVADAQTTFRAVLDAMARPGTLHHVGANLSPPAPLYPATAAVLLTLVDNETPLWLDEPAAKAREWLAFHCGAVTTEQPAEAEFALALKLPELAQFSSGTDEAPESSTTLIVQLAALGRGARYRLTGPGLREPTLLAAAGLPVNFAAMWQSNHSLFPRGIDLVLCAGTTVTALPRSVSIEEV